MNWSRDVIGWSHISPVPIFSTPFTGFLFATSAGLAPLRRYGLTLILKVAPAQCVYDFYFRGVMPYYKRRRTWAVARRAMLSPSLNNSP